MTLTLLLIGPPGAGKSTTLQSLSSEFEHRRIPHSTLESEQLSMGWPLLPSITWIPLLAALLAAQRTAGRTLFLIAATPETPSDLSQIQAAIPTTGQITVCLSAPADLIASRLDAREPDTWPGKQHLIAHAHRLAEQIPNFPGITETISTAATTPAEIAHQLLRDVLSRD